jgi:hypothetical protein
MYPVNPGVGVNEKQVFTSGDARACVSGSGDLPPMDRDDSGTGALGDFWCRIC